MSKANARSGPLDEVQNDLVVVRDRIRSAAILAGFLNFLTIVTGLVLLFSLLAGLNVLPVLTRGAARWVALAVTAGAGCVLFALGVLRPLFWRPSYECLARLVEERVDGLDNAFIIAIQLGRAARRGGMVEKAIRECRARTRRFDLEPAVDRRPLRRGGLAAAILGLALALYALLAPGSFLAGMKMLLNPGLFVPAAGRAVIDYVRPGSTQLLRGQEIRLEVGTRDPVADLSRAFVHMVSADGKRTQRSLAPLSTTEFSASLGTADLPFDYLVEVEGTQSNWYSIGVIEKPAVKALSVRYEYPEYTQLTDKEFIDFDGAIAAPVGTRVTLYVQATRPLAGGYLDFGGSRTDLLAASDDQTRQASFLLREDGLYRIRLTDENGNTNDTAAPYVIKAIQDLPARITIPIPGRDVTAPIGSNLSIALEAADDYGLEQVSLLLSQGEGSSARVLEQWNDIGAKAVTLPFTLAVQADSYEVGKTYYFYALAVDNNPLPPPRESQSIRYGLRIVDSSTAAAESVAATDAVLQGLRALLAKQILAAEDARSLQSPEHAAPDEVERIKDSQAAIRGDAGRLSASIKPDPPALQELKRALDALIAGEMTEVVDACAAAVDRMTTGDAADLRLVVAHQDRIIEILKRLIGIAQALLDDAGAGRLSEGNSIPSEVQDKLRTLLEELQDFIVAQKKVVEATNNLAALPVDDFTDADKRRLAELAAAEQDWSRFLKEAYSDLSKLPRQDFSDPSMLKDAVETYSEVEMAADALSKAAVTLAVPHEQAGLELAEELTTHLEKWLPDVPDRLKWEMEEPLADADVPMAQLPASLQDVVGDLMEQEEDLLSDVEDVSSSWADSLDKGAGWDAMDGPISNMSAQGVTGNALPNASEIAGRSGEGRTGRAAGEFVADTAVGKGGRRTPTRITPDDFVAGQVEDTSNESAAGATGGGKESGAGQRGLEGPVPAQLSGRIAALAGRQAEITSAAQTVNVSLRLAGYPNADMEAAISAMTAAGNDLQAGHLGNAIRRRAVLLNSMKNVSTVVGRRILVHKDGTLVLPKTIQDAIIDGAHGQGPRGYEHLLRGYYESLSAAR